MMASSSAMPPVRVAREATTPLMERTATSVVEPPILTTITPLGSSMDTPAPTAAATVERTSAARRAPRALTASSNAARSTRVTPRAHGNHHTGAVKRPAAADGLFREFAQKRGRRLDIAHRAVQHRRDEHRRARRAPQHLPGVAPAGKHVIGIVARGEHITRLAQHHALALQKDRHIGRTQVDAHAAG